MDAHTDGSAASTVLTHGSGRSFECWRRFADRGRSRRPEHIHRLLTEVLQPKQVGKLADLDAAITNWEYNLQYWQAVNPERSELSEDQKRLILTNMCPNELSEFLTKEAKRFDRYELLKTECQDWIARATNPKGAASGNLHALENAEENHDDEADLELTGDQKTDYQNLLALVTNNNLKVKKGKGKGKSSGKNGPARQEGAECWGCGEKGHLKRDCPNAQADAPMAAAKSGGKGGKDKGKGKGTWYPSPQWWNQIYPGPSREQWKSWQPPFNKGYGKNGGAMKSLAPTGPQPGPFDVPGMFLSLKSAKPAAEASAGVRGALAVPADEPLPGETPMTKKHVKMPQVKRWKGCPTQNAFEALKETEDENLDTNNDEDPEDEFMDSEEEIPEAEMARVFGPPIEKPEYKAPIAKPKSIAPSVAKPERIATDKQDHSAPVVEPECITTSVAEPECTAVTCRCNCNYKGISVKPQGPMLCVSSEASSNSLSSSGPDKSNNPTMGFLQCLRDIRRDGVEKLQAMRESTFEGKWEKLETTLDSGATVTVINPKVGKWYKMVESPGSAAGAEYEVANGDLLKNLGQKALPIVTREGTFRAMLAQCADVSGNLTSARALHHSGHLVVLDGEDSFVYNKVTGEVNAIEDDGSSYKFDMWVLPPEELAELGLSEGFARQLP